MAIIVGIISGIVVMALLYKPFFGDPGGFFECVRYLFTPDVISWFRGEWDLDWWAKAKISLWFMCGAVAGFLGYACVNQLLTQ